MTKTETIDVYKQMLHNYYGASVDANTAFVPRDGLFTAYYDLQIVFGLADKSEITNWHISALLDVIRERKKTYQSFLKKNKPNLYKTLARIYRW